jgi:hypothetical protein
MATIASQLTNPPNLVTMGRVLFVPFVLASLYLIASIGFFRALGENKREAPRSA